MVALAAQRSGARYLTTGSDKYHLGSVRAFAVASSTRFEKAPPNLAVYEPARWYIKHLRAEDNK
jgi:hypothetical protein